MAKKKGTYQPRGWETMGDTKHWTRLFNDMMDSPAFKALTPNAKLLYLYLKREYMGPYNKMPDTVVLPYVQIVELTGIPKRKVKSIIEELIRYGFITVSQSGGLYRSPNQYTFISNWMNLSHSETEVLSKAAKEARKISACGFNPDTLPKRAHTKPR